MRTFQRFAPNERKSLATVHNIFTPTSFWSSTAAPTAALERGTGVEIIQRAAADKGEPGTARTQQGLLQDKNQAPGEPDSFFNYWVKD